MSCRKRFSKAGIFQSFVFQHKSSMPIRSLNLIVLLNKAFVKIYREFGKKSCKNHLDDFMDALFTVSYYRSQSCALNDLQMKRRLVDKNHVVQCRPAFVSSCCIHPLELNSLPPDIQSSSS